MSLFGFRALWHAFKKCDDFLIALFFAGSPLEFIVMLSFASIGFVNGQITLFFLINFFNWFIVRNLVDNESVYLSFFMYISCFYLS